MKRCGGAWIVGVVGAVLVAAASGCRSAHEGSTGERLEALFDRLHAEGAFDGAVVVSVGDRILIDRGYGWADRDRGIPFTSDTPADGASLAKTLTAALLVMLERDGLIRLDDPVSLHVENWPYPELRIHHLLSHSSGLPDYGELDPHVPPGSIRTTAAFVDVLAQRQPPLAFDPGTRFSYSSLAYDVAALAASRAARQPLPELMAERIFEPFGMRATFLRPGRLADFPGVRTLAYDDSGGEAKINDVYDLEAFHGGSNIYMSTRDLHRWGTAFAQRRIAHAASVERLAERPAIGNGRSALGYGNWYLYGNGSRGSYAGHLAGFHSELLWDSTREATIAYMSNNTLDPWLQHGIVLSIRAILAGEEPPSPHPPEDVSTAEPTVDAIRGAWRTEEGFAFDVLGREDGFSVRSDGVEYPVYRVSPDAFYVPGLDWMLGFVSSRDAITGMVVRTNESEFRATRSAP